MSTNVFVISPCQVPGPWPAPVHLQLLPEADPSPPALTPRRVGQQLQGPRSGWLHGPAVWRCKLLLSLPVVFKYMYTVINMTEMLFNKSI